MFGIKFEEKKTQITTN